MAISFQNISVEFLPNLEQLMTEFFNPSVNYERKQEIKTIVNNFACQDNSWCYSIKFIVESKSVYTKVFCFALLQDFIVKKWSTLTLQVKTELKNYLWEHMIDSYSKNDSCFIQNKFCQLLATILRLDFNRIWKNYFDDLYKLITNFNTIKLGIKLLNITLEEIYLTPNDITEEDKKKLTKLIINEVPLIIELLTSILKSFFNKLLGNLYITPPASPTNNNIDLNNKELRLKNICLNTKKVLNQIDSNSIEILELILKCESSIFSFLTINDYYSSLNESVLEFLFIFSTFGCAGSNFNKETSIGTLTMTCLNELLSKNYVYNDNILKFYLGLFDIGFKVLLIIDSDFDLNDLDDQYLEKFTDSIRIFVTNQIFLKQTDSIHFYDFVEKFFQLSVKEKWNKHFKVYLEVWSYILDNFLNKHLLNKKEDNSKIKVAFTELIKQVLFKLQYRYNNKFLLSLDDEELNDYDQTELQAYLSYCIEFIYKTYSFIPEETINLLNSFLDETFKVSMSLDDLLNQSESFNNENNLNLKCLLKDFSILIQIWQRLSDNFIGKNFHQNFNMIKSLLEKVLYFTSYFNEYKLFILNEKRKLFFEETINLHQGNLLLLKFLSHWISQFYNESIQNNDSNSLNVCSSFIQKICDECVKTIIIVIDQTIFTDFKTTKMYTEKIVKSSLLCLLSMSVSVRPKFLLELPSIQLFFDKLFSSINNNFDCKTCLIFDETNRLENIEKNCINCSYINQLNTLPKNKSTFLKLEREQELIWIDILSNILLLPWSQVSDNLQEWDKRSEKHKFLISTFYEKIIEKFKSQSLNEKILKNSIFYITLNRNLFLLTNLVNNHVESPTKTKKILLVSLSEFLEFILAIIPFNILNEELGENLLNFLVSVLKVFMNHINLSFVDQFVKILLNSISQNNLDSMPTYKISLIEKFLKVFIFIVEQPNSTFKSILPKVLEMSLGQLYENVINSNSIDLLSIYYDFLFKFLLNNSKFFFKNQLCIDQFKTNQEETINEQYFLKIFQIFGKSFTTTSIDLFKQNLNALDALNYRQKLFHKKIFKDNFLQQFITFFLQKMIENDFKNLNDELTSVIYSLASIDYKLFKEICIFQVSNLFKPANNVHENKLLTNEYLEDIPTFNRDLFNLINGVRYYKNSHFCILLA